MKLLVKVLKINKLLIALMAILISSFTLAAIKTDTASFVDTSAYTSDFVAIPPFLETATGKPSVVMAFDVSGSMLEAAYENGARKANDLGDTFSDVIADGSRPNGFYGYFDPTSKYRYDTTNEVFLEDASGDWDGNFLNWLTMRRVDVARKVMVGGKVNDRAGELINGNTVWVLEGEVEYRSQDSLTMYDPDSSSYSPIPDSEKVTISMGEIVSESLGSATDTQVLISEKFEMGTFTDSWTDEQYSDPDNWPRIKFLNDYTTPIVVAVTLTHNGTDPSIARVHNVRAGQDDARFGLIEWKSSPDDHTSADTIFYIVAEAGCHAIDMADGSDLEFCAGSHTERWANNDSRIDTIAYDEVFDATPAVFAGVSTYKSDNVSNTTDTNNRAVPELTVRTSDIDDEDFDVQLTTPYSDGSDGDGVKFKRNEVIHWIAIEKTNGGTTNTGSKIEVGALAANSGSDAEYSATFNTTDFSNKPFMAVASQTSNATKPYFVRIGETSELDGGTGWTKTGFTVRLQNHDNTSFSTSSPDEREDLAYIAAAGAPFPKVRVAVTEEPKGLVQNNDQKVNFGLSVYNFDHTQLSMNTIIGSNKVNGQTMNPCYPIFEEDRWPAYSEMDNLADDGMKKEVFVLSDGVTTREYLCVPTGIHAPNDNIVRVIEEYPMVWGTTAIAETMVEIGRYARQESPHYNDGNTVNATVAQLDSNGDPVYSGSVLQTTTASYPDFDLGNDWDPYYDSIQGQTLDCKKVFALNFNDGAPYRDYDGSASDHLYSSDYFSTITNDKGTGDREVLDNVALALRQNDCRTEAGMDNFQEVISYYVFAALDTEAQSTGSYRKMMEAAARGGFVDIADDAGVFNHLPDPMWPPSTDSYSESSYDFGAYSQQDPENCDANEWDADGDCVPDTFYLAQDGDEISDALQNAIDDILARAASGGAASVVSTTSGGEGALFQSSFVPTKSDDNVTVNWFGDIQAYFIDSDGYLRADGGTAGKLDDYTDDPIMDSCFDADANEVRMKLSTSVESRPTKAQIEACSDSVFNIDPIESNEDKPLWSAANELSKLTEAQVTEQRGDYTANNTTRYILTALPDISGNLVMQDFMPDTFTSDLVGLLDTDNTTDAENLVDFIRGKEFDDGSMRNRTVEMGSGDAAVETIQRLGDVIYSTPVAVGRPSERLNLLYDDASYNEFFQQYRDRRTMIYVGANDGMLHAFNGGWYDRQNSEFSGSKDTRDYWEFGQEVWAYVPYNLLPHLKVLSEVDYGVQEGDHNYFVDQTPYIFDAKIFGSDSLVTGQPDVVVDSETVETHPGGWGTVMVVGFRMGGGESSVYPDPSDLSTTETVRPAYLIFDITNPELEPVLLAEFTHEKLGMSFSTPTALTVQPTVSLLEEDWFLVMGSGPSATQAGVEQVASFQNAHLFLLNLKTMALHPTFGVNGVMDLGATDAENAFVSDLVATDWDIDVTTDAIYFGTTQGLDTKDSNGNVWPDANGDGIPDSSDGVFDEWAGKLFRLMPTAGLSSLTHSWSVDVMYDPGQPINSRPGVSFDKNKNRWIHFGTGRYLNTADTIDETDGMLVGIKEPRAADGSFAMDSGSVSEITSAMVDVSDATVEEETGDLDGSVSLSLAQDKVQYLEERQMQYADSSDYVNGWYKNLDDSGFRGTRAMGSPTILGGFMSQTTFAPAAQACVATGVSRLHALRYTTGTAWTDWVFVDENDPDATESVVESVVIGDTASMSPGIHMGGGRKDGEATLINLNSDLSISTTTESNLEGIYSQETSWREL
ncbi:MAG: hypothetical protein C9356_04305 [Oleiphilus sp.]|nr:MAG: hypothetical protein C9356_04305 [Oleiphilus sp.]